MKKNIVIATLVTIIIALLAIIIYQRNDKILLGDNKENVNSENSANKNQNDENNSNSTNSQALWKMTISNKDGANVYEYNNGEILTSLSYNTEVNVIGDYYNYDSKEYYVYVTYNLGESDNISTGYIKVSDLKLIDNSITKLTYETEKKYMAEGVVTNIYDGPGLLFINKNKKINIPEGEVLNIKYYNETKTSANTNNPIWVYIEYNGINGWITIGSEHSENYPYEGYREYSLSSLKELEGKKGTINTGNTKLYMYLNPFEDEIIEVIPKNIKLEYSASVDTGLGTYGAYQVTYNNKTGWIKTFDAVECENSIEGALNFVSSEPLELCYNQKLQ